MQYCVFNHYNILFFSAYCSNTIYWCVDFVEIYSFPIFYASFARFEYMMW